MYKLAFGINRQQTLFHSTLKKISPPYYTLWLSHSVFFFFCKEGNYSVHHRGHGQFEDIM